MPGEGGLKVLVVEDDQNFRQLLDVVFSLEDTVSEVRTVDDGREAISLCVDYDPDVVVIDMFMPKMSGEEVGNRIKQVLPRARIISLSGLEAETKDWADEHIVKAGSTLEDLRQAVCANGIRRIEVT